MDIENFRSLVADFLQTSKMSRTEFGVKALNDPGFVFGLFKDKGRECRSATVKKVVEFIENNTEKKRVKKVLSRTSPINERLNGRSKLMQLKNS